jgi:hypothetical protein
VNLLFTGLPISQTAVPLFKTMGYVLVFISGFLTCAVVLGTLWFLRECERARTFKALRHENEWLRAVNAALRETDESCRRIVARVHAGLGQLRMDFRLGGRVALPSPASPKAKRPEVNMQHARKLINARLTGPSNGGPDFLWRQR